MVTTKPGSVSYANKQLQITAQGVNFQYEYRLSETKKLRPTNFANLKNHKSYSYPQAR